MQQLPYYKSCRLVSAQKSGRTWLRMIFAKVLQQIKIDPSKYEMLPSHHAWCSNVKAKYKPAKLDVIFLFRDPRDCVVSRYFEITKRRLRPKNKNAKKVYNDTLKEYIRRQDQYGIDSIIDYMNEWIENRELFRSFLPVSYEELTNDTLEVVTKILDFIHVECPSSKIQQAISYASFDNMRRIELTGKGNLLKNYHGTFGKRHKADDPETFRTRKGKIGGYKESLDSSDIDYVDSRIVRLNDFFPYK